MPYCTACGQGTSEPGALCTHCGGPLADSAAPLGTPEASGLPGIFWAMAAVLLLVIVAVVASSINSRPSDPSRPQFSSPAEASAYLKAQAAAKFAAMAPAEHLATARSLVVPTATTAALAEAEHQLSAIPATAPETAEAKQLTKQIESLRAAISERQRKQQIAQAQNLAKQLEQNRVAVAQEIDDYLLRSGIESRTEATGPQHRRLIVHDVLAGRVRARAIGQADLTDKLRLLGFEKLVYTNDYDTTFTWDLTKR